MHHFLRQKPKTQEVTPQMRQAETHQALLHSAVIQTDSQAKRTVGLFFCYK